MVYKFERRDAERYADAETKSLRGHNKKMQKIEDMLAGCNGDTDQWDIYGEAVLKSLLNDLAYMEHCKNLSPRELERWEKIKKILSEHESDMLRYAL